MEIVWTNALVMFTVHALSLYGLTLLPRLKVVTLVFMWSLGLLSTLGVQAGAHRLWCHRAYKANFGLRLFLSLAHVLALQNDVYEWSRDHRAHHRYSDTDADPHNSRRGFFFSHVGWLLVKKHPEVGRRGRTISMDDLKADPIVMFQRRWYAPMVLLIWGLLPTLIPWYFWDEPLYECLLCCVFTRYVLSVNLTWLTNSWAHLYGSRPYDGRIAPTEVTVRHMLLGEGFHNYHHAFPWDYSASELGPLDVFNPCTALIDLWAKLGWAWDLKKVQPEVVAKKVAATGNPLLKYRRGATLWEWSTGTLTMSVNLIIFLLIKYLFA